MKHNALESSPLLVYFSYPIFSALESHYSVNLVNKTIPTAPSQNTRPKNAF